MLNKFWLFLLDNFLLIDLNCQPSKTLLKKKYIYIYLFSILCKLKEKDVPFLCCMLDYVGNVCEQFKTEVLVDVLCSILAFVSIV
jgi:hypothetical protein